MSTAASLPAAFWPQCRLRSSLRLEGGHGEAETVPIKWPGEQAWKARDSLCIAAGILCGESWVLVSPHRTERPWQGEVGQKAAPSAASYDPKCYLCPGNQRAGGAVNPAYEGIFSFVNDYAALLPDSAAPAGRRLRRC